VPEIGSEHQRLLTALDARWQAKPWTQLVFACDFNTSFPENANKALEPSCTGTSWCDRCTVIWAFATKNSLAWTSTFLGVGDHTHVHRVWKSCRTIDYVLFATVAGHSSSLTCRIGYEYCCDSDHYSILSELVVNGKIQKKRRRQEIPKHVFRGISVQTSFQALVDVSLDEQNGIGSPVLRILQRLTKRPRTMPCRKMKVLRSPKPVTVIC